ncbi:MAG: transposase [Proteobacteria bacterium]|nr:transposase [Pseudomonadota bacterium]
MRLGELSKVRRVALDESSRAKGHEYVTLFADADADPARRRVILVAKGKDAATVEAFEANLRAHHGKPSQIEAVSIDLSPAFISGVSEHLPHAQITFDKFHVIAHASQAIDKMRRIEQKLDPSLKGKRWVLLKDRAALTAAPHSPLVFQQSPILCLACGTCIPASKGERTASM